MKLELLPQIKMVHDMSTSSTQLKQKYSVLIHIVQCFLSFEKWRFLTKCKILAEWSALKTEVMHASKPPPAHFVSGDTQTVAIWKHLHGHCSGGMDWWRGKKKHASSLQDSDSFSFSTAKPKRQGVQDWSQSLHPDPDNFRPVPIDGIWNMYNVNIGVYINGS